VADAVATYASVDPCIACTERVIILDESGKKKDIEGIHNLKLS
jgi:energy-converting hydrogenase A subunit O